MALYQVAISSLPPVFVFNLSLYYVYDFIINIFYKESCLPDRNSRFFTYARKTFFIPEFTVFFGDVSHCLFLQFFSSWMMGRASGL